MFGGTFDPPHIAHLVMAIDVREALDLDVVLMMVAGEPWQKLGADDTGALQSVTPAVDRLAMTRAAAEGIEGLEVSDLEIRRGGPTYTVDTLVEISAEEPDAELHLIMGADAAVGLHTWDRHRELPRLCRIVVVDRPGTSARVADGFEVLRVEAPRHRSVEHRAARPAGPRAVPSLPGASGRHIGHRGAGTLRWSGMSGRAAVR